jgi:hypothetical protein
VEKQGLAFGLVHKLRKLRRSTIILDREHSSGGDRQGKRAKIDEQIPRLDALSVPLRDAPRRRFVECWYQPIDVARLKCRGQAVALPAPFRAFGQQHAASDGWLENPPP